MVFFFTSPNIKLLRNIILDYKHTEETTPFEYMKTYIEKCPENVEDSKITWIAETFLGIEKHFNFLQEISNHLSEELTDEEQDFCKIIFFAITFEITPKDTQLLYKSIFNLSKDLLLTFTGFLSNNEVLTFISQLAQTYYDAIYVTDKIIGPLFVWQPYISEMAHTYAEYVKKIYNRKIKPPTIPIQPTVLTRKGKEPIKAVSQPTLPATPPNSMHAKDKRKMLTKSVIDRRLKEIHEKNKQKAEHLLKTVKNNDFPFAQPAKSYNKRNSDSREVAVELPSYQKPKKNVLKSALPPVRDNIATLKRLNQRIQMTEQQEVEWIQSLMNCCRNSARFEILMENDRKEKEKERLYDIEKKHVMGQISYEEAVLAKKRVIDENKNKYEQFQKEKASWDREIQQWKQAQLANGRTRVENFTIFELNVMAAKQSVIAKNKERAENMKKEHEALIAHAMREKQEELDHKIKFIKEINILSMIAKRAKVPRIVDFTETSGLGLLCEMSLAELQERVAAMKIGIKEELDRKKSQIKESNYTAKRELEDVKNSIKTFFSERADIRKQAKTTKNPPVTLDGASSTKINDLKKILEEKRNLRKNMNKKESVRTIPLNFLPELIFHRK